ncbi:MAG: cytochrome c peroxidase [Planctomycetota bacterium]
MKSPIATAILGVATALGTCGLAPGDRPKPRPSLTAIERQELIARLREQYAKSPSEWPAPTVDDGVDWEELGPLPEVVHPADNPGTPEKIKLGKQLFFEPRVSGSGQIACASCHDPDLGWADGRTVSFGHNRKQLKRNAPSVLHSAFRKVFFWDGRAESLEDQAEQVLNNPDEMHSEGAVVVENLAGIPEYVEAFEAVFGEGGLTRENAVMAIAAFERTVVGGRTKFDFFLDGRVGALTDEALAGLHLYRTTARCMNCHHGPLLTDDKFHNLGMTHYGRRFEDLGRYLITNDPADVGAFRTPSLRDVGNSAPYMHNGMLTLDEALVLYNAGMRTERPRKAEKDDPLFPKKSPLLKPLGLNEQDFIDLKAFLGSMSEPRIRVDPPPLPGL